VRQLRNVLEQAMIASPSETISAGLLHRIISLSFASHDGPAMADDAMPAAERRVAPESIAEGELCPAVEKLDSHWVSLEQMEREHILRTLEHTFYNRSAAARLLGVTRQSLLRKMKRYNLEFAGKQPIDGVR
jgi:DNA-binding NtrC family response regulator